MFEQKYNLLTAADNTVNIVKTILLYLNKNLNYVTQLIGLQIKC